MTGQSHSKQFPSAVQNHAVPNSPFLCRPAEEGPSAYNSVNETNLFTTGVGDLVCGDGL